MNPGKYWKREGMGRIATRKKAVNSTEDDKERIVWESTCSKDEEWL